MHSPVRDVLYYVYKEVYNMRTNIVLDEAMVKKAFRYSGAKSKKELVHQALKEFIDARQRLDLRDLGGRWSSEPDTITRNYGRAPEMVLVDTSAIIDYLRENDSEAAHAVQYILDNNIPFGINSLIYQEVLQGVKTEKYFIRLKKYLETQIFYSLKDEKESYASAAMIYFRCRKKGITIGSTIDCLIAQAAIENNLFLLHNDSDFDRISEVADLKIFRVASI